MSLKKSEKKLHYAKKMVVKKIVNQNLLFKFVTNSIND